MMGLDGELQPGTAKLIRSRSSDPKPTDISNPAVMNAAATEANKATPPKFKQKETRQFKSKAPKAGQKG